MKGIVGRTRFLLERVPVPRGPFAVATRCLLCGEPVAVEHSALHAVFRVGAEIVGVVCDTCLSRDTRARLAQLREAATRAVTR